MNLHGLRILDFKTSRSKTGGDGAFKKQPNVSECEKKKIQKVDSKKASDCRDADAQHVSHKTCKASSRKYSFLHRRTNSEIFRTPSPSKMKNQTPKKISFEDLKTTIDQNKAIQQSRFNFFNRDSILNLHLKGGDVRRNKKTNKKEFDTTVLFDSALPNKKNAKKPAKNEGVKHRKKMLLDDTFGFLKNNRSITSCYRLNHKFINLDQCLVGLRKFKNRKVSSTRPPNKSKITKHCTCVHFPLKILSSIPSSMVDSSGYYNIVTPNGYTPNVHTPKATLGNKSAREFKIEPGNTAPENRIVPRNQVVPKVKTAPWKNTKKSTSPRIKTAIKNRSTIECECPPSNNWGETSLNKDVFVSVSSSSLEPKIQCGCDAAVDTNKSQLATRKPSQAEHKCCQMKKNTPRLPTDSCKPVEKPRSHNLNTIKKERLKELVKEERNTFFTDFISNIADFRVGQTKHKFSVQCMKYIFLGLLVVVWSPCLLALFLGWVIMCPQRISSSLGGPQLLKQMQTNSNFTLNVKKKRSANETHRIKVPMNNPVNYVRCLPIACTRTRVPTHTLANTGKKKSSISVHQRVPMNTFPKVIQNKSLPPDCQRTKMHSLPNKAKRKCSVTGDDRTPRSSNILMSYIRNKWPISECPRPQKSNHVKNHRQKNFMSSVASWYTRTVASFSNMVSVVKLLGFRQPTCARTAFIPSLNPMPRNRCNLYYGKGRGWVVKPQVIQNMRCEYSPDLHLTNSSKDGILKPKSKVSFSERQAFANDCGFSSKRKVNTSSPRTSKIEHFSTVPFEKEQTSTNQQVNIEPKKLDTSIEYPYKTDALYGCKHRQIPAKGNMFNPHNEPNYVVVPLHGIVIGYPGGSGYYYPTDQTTQCTSKLSNKNKLLSKYVTSNLPKKYKSMAIGKSQKLSHSCRTCLTNKPCSELKHTFSNQLPDFTQALNAPETHQSQTVQFKSFLSNKATNGLLRHGSIVKTETHYRHRKPGCKIDKVAYHIPKKSPILVFDKILHSKSKQGEGATANNYLYQQNMTSETKASKALRHKCNCSKVFEAQISKRLTGGQVNIPANSSTAFESAFQLSHMKKLTAMKEKNGKTPYKWVSDTKLQNTVFPLIKSSKNVLAANKIDKTKELCEYSGSDKTDSRCGKMQHKFFMSEKTPKSKIDKSTKNPFINRASTLSPIESSTFDISPEIKSKIRSKSFDRPSKYVCNMNKEIIPFEKLSKSCKSISKNRKLPLKKITQQSHNILDQRKSPSIGTVKQKKMSASFERASKCTSNRVQKNRFPLHNEKSIQSREINTNPSLDKTAEHNPDTLYKKLPNIVCSSNQVGTCLTTYCARDPIKETVPSVTIFDHSQKHVLAADYQWDKAGSCLQSLKSFQYQRFSDGLKKYVVLSKSCKNNQSKSTQCHTNKALPYQCNSLYPGYRKQLTNLKEFDFSRKLALPPCRKAFKRNYPKNSMTSLRQKKQVLEFTSSPRFLTSYRKEHPVKSCQLMSSKKSLSSIMATSAYSKLSPPSQILSHCSKSMSVYSKPKSYSSYRISNPLKHTFFRQLTSSYSIPKSRFSRGNLSFSPRFYVSCNCSSLSNHTSSSLYCKSVIMGNCDSSCIHTCRSLKSILCKFKSYDEYEYKVKHKPLVSLPCTATFKRNLQLYPNLRNNITGKSCRAPCTYLSKKLQTAQINNKPKRISPLCKNNSVITKHQLKIELKKRLRYLDKFLRNNIVLFECFNKSYDARICKTHNRSSSSEEMKLKYLHYPENYNTCIACKTSYLTGKIQLLKKLLSKAGLQEKSHSTRTKRTGTPRCLPSSHKPQVKQSSTLIDPAIFNACKRCQKSQTKLLGNSPLSIQKQPGLLPTCDWLYTTLNYPSVESQRHQCTPKCFQNLLDYLHIHFLNREGKGRAPQGSKGIRTLTPSNSSVVTVCSRDKCEKKNRKHTKRQLSPQDNLIGKVEKEGNITNLCREDKRVCGSKCKEVKRTRSPKGKEEQTTSPNITEKKMTNWLKSKEGDTLNGPNSKVKRTSSPKNKEEKRPRLLINNKEKRIRSPKSTNEERIKLPTVNEEKTTTSPLYEYKRISSLKNKDKVRGKLAKNKEKRTNSPLRINKRGSSPMNNDERLCFFKSIEGKRTISPNKKIKTSNSPKIKEVKKTKLSKYNDGKRTSSPRNKDKKTKRLAKNIEKKRANSPTTLQGKAKRSRSPKIIEEKRALNLQISKKVKKATLPKSAREKHISSPNNKKQKKYLPKSKVKKKKNINKSIEKRKTKRKPKKRSNPFPIRKEWLRLCLVDLVQTIRQAETTAWPVEVNCNRMYIQTLKKRPCLWIYKLWPTIYPSFLRLLILIKRIGTIVLLCVCSPLQLCSYCCIEIIV